LLIYFNDYIFIYLFALQIIPCHDVCPKTFIVVAALCPTDS